jgi:hypothetical protein
MNKVLTFAFILVLYVVSNAQTVKTLQVESELLIPSAIELRKPFVVKNIELFPDNELFIFDKQGNLVYHTEFYDNSWQGKKEDGSELIENEMCYYILDDGRGTSHSGYLQVLK